MRPTLLLTGFFVLAVAPSSAGAAPDPYGASEVARRTPPAWRSESFPLTEYFSRGELAGWRDYRGAQRRVFLIDLALEIAFYQLLLLTPLGRRLLAGCRTLAARLTRRWPFSGLPALGRVLRRLFGDDWSGGLLFAYALFGVLSLLSLPLAIWQEVLAQRAGLSTYSVGAWAWDTGKGVALSVVLFGCLVLGLYGLMRRFPRRWWLVLALPAAAGMVAYGFVEPHLPRMYREVKPLVAKTQQQRELRERLGRLVRARGLELGQIKVIRASRTSRAMNAYVVGLGRQRQVVIYDTLLREATLAELEVAVAHELGHEQHRNDLRTYGLASLALVGLLALLAFVLRRGGRWLGYGAPGDIGSLPLLAFVLWLVFTLAGPLIGHRSRQQEREADRAALTLTGDPEAFIRLQVRLARRNRADVRPPAWVTFWLRGHPSVYERIGTARWYARWLRASGQDRPAPERRKGAVGAASKTRSAPKSD